MISATSRIGLSFITEPRWYYAERGNAGKQFEQPTFDGDDAWLDTYLADND